MGYGSLKEVEDRINRNYACMKELESQIPLQETREKKLKLLSFIGQMYSWYVTGIYSSDVLEQQIIESGNELSFFPSEEPQEDQILVVMSEAGNIGGHTLLVHNWIKWDIRRQYSIAFTDMEESAVPDFIIKAVQESGGKLFFLSGRIEEKAQKLLETSQTFSRILLFTHMEDVVPILAYGNKNWKIPVYFYNHADWRFSFGYSVSDAILNLYQFDIDKAIRYRGILSSNCVHLQFPGMGKMVREQTEKLDKKEIRRLVRKKYQVSEEEKLIVSMGYGYRYKNIIGYEFESYVRDVVRCSGNTCRFLIIGPDRKEEKWLRLEKDTQEKARALGLLPRDEAERLISAADIYVLSFPQGSSGKAVAEEAEVPCLWLDIIGRGLEQSDIRSSASVSELTEKTLDILSGNKNKYLKLSGKWHWDQGKWLQIWEDTFNKFLDHKIRAFYPQRRIEKQEYVNCQLLQEVAAQNISASLAAEPLDQPVMEELFRLDRKYDMGLFWRYMDLLRKQCDAWKTARDKYFNLSDKRLHLYKTALKWIEIKQKGAGIGEYLYSQGYRRAAIYGMSDMGVRLLEELSNGPVRVAYGIDRRAKSLHSAVRVLLPADELEPVDVILNTTTVENSEIQASLAAKTSAEMLRLDELFLLMKRY